MESWQVSRQSYNFALFQTREKESSFKIYTEEPISPPSNILSLE